MTPPQIENPIKECPICDMMVTLGLVEAVCASAAPGEKTKCQSLIKPLEEKKVKAVDALADVIEKMGDNNLNEVLDRMNLLIYAATEKAKGNMIKAGKLNPDGTPK